jgi:hypothetical protein
MRATLAMLVFAGVLVSASPLAGAQNTTPPPADEAVSADDENLEFDLPAARGEVRGVDTCNDNTPDWIDVERFRGNADVPASYVRAHAATTVRFRWLDANAIINALLEPGETYDTPVAASARAH